MGMMIRLRSPDGTATKVVDSTKFNVKKALEKGFTRAGDVMIAAHTRAMPTRKQEQRLTPAEQADSGLPAEPPVASPAGLDEPWLVKNLPGIGGAAGGALGGAGGTVFGLGIGGVPGALGGAAVGGAGGEAVRQLVDHAMGIEAPKTPQDALSSIGTEAAIQTAMEGGGRVIGAGAKALGKPLMNAAMLAARRWTPEAAQVAIREGIAATAGGIAKLKTKIEDAAGISRRILLRAGEQGNVIPSAPFIKNVLQDLGETTAENFLPSGAVQESEFKKYAIAFLKRNHLPTTFEEGVIPYGSGQGRRMAPQFRDFTPIQLDRLVRIADEEAKALHAQATAAAKGLGAPVLDATQSAEAVFLKKFADNGRKLLRVISDGITEIHPERGAISLEESKRLTQELMGVRDIIAPLGNKNVWGRVARRAAVPLAVGSAAAAIPGGNNYRDFGIGAGVGAAISSPELLSQLALILNHPSLADATSQTARLVGAFGSEPRRAAK